MPRGAGPAALAGRGLYQCNRCKTQTSPTAGTIFHATKLSLKIWFAAIHLVVTSKNGISSVELGRRLGVKQPTAWTVKHKIMAVMARREEETPLSGRVEMDDAYLGGVRSGGKRGRGAAGKTPFVAAVSTSPEGRPRKAKLAPVRPNLNSNPPICGGADRPSCCNSAISGLGFCHWRKV